jgi:hypothetical protein
MHRDGANHKRRERLTALVLTCVWFDLSKMTVKLEQKSQLSAVCRFANLLNGRWNCRARSEAMILVISCKSA